MDILQEFEFLFDTIKNSCYLFLGLITGYIFWEVCEYYCERAISKVNPLLFTLALCHGASGFFFLPSILIPVDSFLQYAFPDWDIPLLLLLKSSSLLQHRSWLFSSTLIPLVLLSTAIALCYFINKKVSEGNLILLCLLNSFCHISIGLSIGTVAHLAGDFILQWIPSGDTGIIIAGWQTLPSYIWFALSLGLGLSIPFVILNQNQASDFDNSTTEPSSTRVMISCPACAAQLRLPAGRTGNVVCPRCNHSFDANML
jgi:hypothetical protein